MDLEVVADGFGYLESPRWHAGRLWFSDFDRKEVRSWTPDGVSALEAIIPGGPSGLAFVEDGFLVAEMTTRTVAHVDRRGQVTTFADLSGLAIGPVNDMVRDARGHLFVGCFGYDLARRESPRPGPLLHVDPAGRTAVAWADLAFPNGMVVVDEGRTLLVAETSAHRITRFRVGTDGRLGDRAVFADVGPRQPDGLCVDRAGEVWFGSPFSHEFVRLDRSGHIREVVPTPGRWAVAGAFGGADGRTFYGLTAETDMRTFVQGRSKGRIERGIALPTER